MLPEDKTYINSKIQEVDSMLQSDKLDSTQLEKAKDILLELLDKYKEEYLETDTTVYLNYENPIYYIIDHNLFNYKKNVKWIDFPIGLIYQKLAYLSLEQKDYKNCEYYGYLVEKYAPLDLSGRFEIIEMLKQTKEFKKMKKELFNIYNLIFSAKNLAKFYRTMAYYYVEIKSYVIAYALLLESIKYEDNKLAYDEMDYIRMKLKNPNFKLSYNDNMNLMDEYNIPYGLLDRNLRLLETIYEKETDLRNKDSYFNFTINCHLYDITKNAKYILFRKVTFEDVGLELELPFFWKEKENPKETFRESTIAAIVNELNYVMEIRNDGKITTTFESKLEEIKQELRNEHFEILREGILELTDKPFTPKKFVAFAIRKLDDAGNPFCLLEYVTTVKDNVIRFISVTNPKIPINDEKAYGNQDNVLALKRLLSLSFETSSRIENEPINSKDGLELLSENVTYNISEKGLNCSMTIPIDIGGLTKKKENTYSIGDNISFLILNNNRDSVAAKMDEWLTSSCKTTGRELLPDFLEYNINEHHIVEKYAKKPKFKKKVYKCLIFNNKILVFSFSEDENTSNIVNEIIKTLK